MNIILTKDLEPTYVSEIMESIDHEKPEYVNIYIDCPGGEVPTKEIFKDYLENLAIPVTLIAAGHIASCALFLFVETKVNKKVLPSARGLLHQINQGGLQSIDMTSSFFRKLIEEIQYDNSVVLERYKSYLDETDVAAFNRGEDVYLSSKQLEAIISDKKIKRRL